MGPDFEAERAGMVALLRARGVQDERVLAAMGRIPRERFVPPALSAEAYRDSALPIGDEQTISQPFIVARMAAALALSGDERVLEVGAGSGYGAAVLAALAAEVVTVERNARLARRAAANLAAAGCADVTVRVGDGTLGCPELAPFDAIVVTAGGPRVPDALRQQLARGGRLLIPVGGASGRQQLVRVTRVGRADFREERLASVRFVPLVGAQGWPAPPRWRRS
ncbi:MAG: protein-L-isoaspartate(D-aspartate) O-methyltransferase [Planctomycetota bacterium]